MSYQISWSLYLDSILWSSTASRSVNLVTIPGDDNLVSVCRRSPSRWFLISRRLEGFTHLIEWYQGRPVYRNMRDAAEDIHCPWGIHESVLREVCHCAKFLQFIASIGLDPEHLVDTIANGTQVANYRLKVATQVWFSCDVNHWA